MTGASTFQDLLNKLAHRAFKDGLSSVDISLNEPSSTTKDEYCLRDEEGTIWWGYASEDPPGVPEGKTLMRRTRTVSVSAWEEAI